MTIKSRFSLPLALVLAAALSASPVDAQGNGKGNGRGNGNGNKDKQEQQDRRRDRDDDDRWERDNDRRDNPVLRRSSTRDGGWSLSRDRRVLTRNGRTVPRGWCQGRGNPHNTVANCGGYRYSTSRSIWEWIGLGRDGRYDPRYEDRRYEDRRYDDRNVYGSRRTSGSYSTSHSEFHRVQDARCRERMNQADSWAERIRVTEQCKAEHDSWHRSTGTRH